MKRNAFVPFTLKLRDLKKDVDPKTWKLIEPHVEEIIELVSLNDFEYNKETASHFRGRYLDGDFDNESVAVPDKPGLKEENIVKAILAGMSVREAIIKSSNKGFENEMDNSSFAHLHKAANESVVRRDNPGVTLNEDDREYWDYVHTYGSEEEREKAADYFDVSPSAFDETYAQFYELDED